MKISNLINELTKVQAINGDIDCKVCVTNIVNHVKALSLMMQKDELFCVISDYHPSTGQVKKENANT